MKKQDIHDLFDNNQDMSEAEFTGPCHDCGVQVSVVVKPCEQGFGVEGGAVYKIGDTYKVKCEDCFSKEPKLMCKESVEIYSRIVGYMRPVSGWNDAKKKEFGDRTLFNLEKAGE